MSKGIACKCKGTTAARRANWIVIQYRCNYSAFNGGHYTPSDWSCVKCTGCGHHWRTRCAYVDSLPIERNNYHIGVLPDVLLKDATKPAVVPEVRPRAGQTLKFDYMGLGFETVTDGQMIRWYIDLPKNTHISYFVEEMQENDQDPDVEAEFSLLNMPASVEFAQTHPDGTGSRIGGCIWKELTPATFDEISDECEATARRVVDYIIAQGWHDIAW